MNSVSALCRISITALRDEVMPFVSDAYARGQLAAVIYLLANLERQADWSHETQLALTHLLELGVQRAQFAPSFAPDPATPTVERRLQANAEICALLDRFDTLRKTRSLDDENARAERRLLAAMLDEANARKERLPRSMMLEMSGEMPE